MPIYLVGNWGACATKWVAETFPENQIISAQVYHQPGQEPRLTRYIVIFHSLKDVQTAIDAKNRIEYTLCAYEPRVRLQPVNYDLEKQPCPN